MVLVLVGVGTCRQLQASETAVEARFFKQSGVGMLDLVEVARLVVDDLLVVFTPRFSAAVLMQVVTVTASAVAVYVTVGAVTVSKVTVGTVEVSAVTVLVPVVLVMVLLR